VEGDLLVEVPESKSAEQRERELRERTCFAFTCRFFTSTLLPHSTMGMFSHTRTRSRCQVGTFLYVSRLVTSNMMMAQLPWM